MFENWRELLSEDLQHSRFKISFGEAFGRRLRRNYGWIFFVLGGCWFIKIAIHPTPIGRFSEILDRPGYGPPSKAQGGERLAVRGNR